MDKKRFGQYFYNIELMRFVGIVMIMGHHLYLIGLEGDYLFKNCWVWVDFFFILSGSFTYKHFENNNENSLYGNVALNYTIQKFSKFFPFTVISVAFMWIWTYRQLFLEGNWRGFFGKLTYAPFEIFYLSSSGIVSALNAPIWFLSAMFITMPVIVFLILSNVELWKVISFILPILYFGYKGVNTARGWPNDLVRAFVCMALGTIAVMLSKRIKDYVADSSIRKLVCSVAEISCVCAVIYISVLNKGYINLVEPLFIAIVAFMLSQSTCTAKIKNEVIIWAGRITMPMFIFHWCIGTTSEYITDNMKTRFLLYYFGTLMMGIIVIFVFDRISSTRSQNESPGYEIEEEKRS